MPHYLRCMSCKKKVDMYEEPVYCWDDDGDMCSCLMCEKCHIERSKECD
jgi:hypothetical protein